MQLNNKEQLKKLVDLFRENIDRYKTMSYDESNTRSDFIDKFFILLGWDVLNNQGYSEDYREVVREDKVRIEGKTKAPDYSFRLDGNRKFFVEAKKPIVNIQEDRDPAYQVRRYGYSAGCSISILTDFEEFAIYDTRIKPNPNDTAKVARIFYCTYEEYEAKFDELVAWFSPEGIRKGAFDKYVKADKKGTGTVDTDFLKTLSEWRLELAEAIAKKNKELDEIDLNHIVQKILNRIVFLRFAEDRGTTEYGLLKRLLTVKKDFYSQLLIIFDESRTRYNSDLFSQDDKLNIVLEDKVVKDIISNLYYPNSPYEFNVISIELLGTIYERFLGDTITLNSKGKANVEVKPETRKAGGVYYTPSYIVNYIVENTVGRLLEGKTLRDISEMTIVDPACGSGSFLIGVYAYLLKWYLEKYQAEKKYKKLLCADGTKLILQEKKDILIRHIYGVDLDSQAVEVSKLSLLLKLMEDEEAMDSAGLSFTYLPNLENNIKAGNSLVGKDYLDTVAVSLFDKREQHKIKVFDWKEEFAKVFKNGGFDVVLGNPPWVELSNISVNQIDYFKKKYSKVIGSSYDLFEFFTQRSMETLLNDTGVHAFIVPNRFLTGEDYIKYREFLLTHTKILEIYDLGSNVFYNVAMPSCIYVLQKKSMEYEEFVLKVKHTCDFNKFLSYTLNYKNIKNDPKRYISMIDPITEKIDSYTDCFTKYLTNARGVEIGKSNSLIVSEHINNSVPFLVGNDISRYTIKYNKRYLKLGDSNTSYKHPSLYKGDKILIRKTGHGISAVLDTKDYYVIQVIYIYKLKENCTLDIRFLLGILNSKMMYHYYYAKYGEKYKKEFPHIRQTQINQLPIPVLDLTNKKDKTLHDTLVEKVQLMLELQKKHQDSSTQLQIQALDRQIDNLVYQMYGLTQEEITVIEGE